MSSDSLKKNFDYYIKNKEIIIKNDNYYGKYLVIQNEQIVNAYSTEMEAIEDMKNQGFKIGEFIVQIALENDGSSANFISNVYV